MRTLMLALFLTLIFALPIKAADVPAPDLVSSAFSILPAEWQKYLTALFVLIGALRLTMKPAFAAFHAYCAATDSKVDDEFLARIENSKALKSLFFVLDLVASVKPYRGPTTPAISNPNTPATSAREASPATGFVANATAVALLFGLFLFAAGCASTDGRGGLQAVATTATIAKIAAKDATFFALVQHPEWRPKFEEAFQEVEILAAQDRIDVAAIAALVRRLPVKELKGTTAQIIVSDVQIVVEQIMPNNGQIVSADRYADPKVVIAAIRDGMRMGMDM